MFIRLLLLFVIIPLVEIALLIEIGSHIGTLATIALILGTGVLGASLAHRQGLEVLRRIQAKVSQGMMPDEELFDGVLILGAGILLLTPGLLTDITGIVLLVPTSRAVIKKWLRGFLQRHITISQQW